MSNKVNLEPGKYDPKSVDADGWTHGYCDAEGNFLGYAPYMTLVPGLIPAKFHVPSGNIQPTGHQRILPKGKILMTDAGFGGANAAETVMTGLEDDVGGGLAPTGAIPGTAIPVEEETPGPEISPELAARIATRPAAGKAADKPAAGKANETA